MTGRPADSRNARPAIWLIAFMLIQMGCQFALLTSALGGFRQLFRTAAFGMSLLWFVALFRRSRLHPAAMALLIALVIVTVGIFHPLTNSPIGGLATFFLYGAIMAPLFWVPTLAIDARDFRRVVLIFWGLHALSSAVGVLQIKFPGHFQPSLSTTISAMGETYVQGLQIETSQGELVFRPMGLTDTPGGAALAGLYAGLFGLGLLVAERRGPLPWLAFASVMLGIMCLYLSQVRLLLIVFIVGAVVFCAVLLLRRDTKRLAAVLTTVPLIAGLGFGAATTLGGRDMTARLETLVSSKPGDVYYHSRGLFLAHTIQELLPSYPLGAGLGRWGMVYSYFGKKNDPAKDQIWVEIQWTGWLLDGGVPLILAYATALGITFWTAFRIARLRGAGEIWIWGAVMLAYDLGVLATTFGSNPFIGQEGLEFWMLNAALFTAARTEVARQRAALELPIGHRQTAGAKAPRLTPVIA